MILQGNIIKGKMDTVFLIFVLFICISRNLGMPNLTCNDIDPILTSTVQCSCYNPGLGITWYKDGVSLTQCTLLSGQCFTSVGYTFAVDSSTSTYTIDVDAYSYTDCSSVSCSDSITPSDSDLKKISVDESSIISTNLTIDEPSTSHTNGNISFTTDCLYKARATSVNVTAKLSAVTENGNHTLDVDETISEIGSCQSCSYDFASKFLIEFYHKEDLSENKQEAQLRIELFIDGQSVSTSNNITNNMYYVKVGSKQISYTWCIIFEDEVWCIVLIVVFVPFAIVDIIAQGCCFHHKQKRKPEITKYLVCLYICVCIPIIGLLIWFIYHKKGIVDSEQDEEEDVLKVLKIEKESITFSWKRCKLKLPTQIYILRYSEMDPERRLPNEDKGVTLEYTVTGLRNSTYYNLILECVDGTNKVIKKYKPKAVRTYGVPEAPKSFSVVRSSVSGSSFTVRWEPLLDGGKQQTFILTCSTRGHESMTKEIKHNKEKHMSYTWVGLSERTSYDLELRSKNANGDSTRIQPIKETTLGKPDPPTYLRVENITTESMTVIWKKGFNGGYPQWFQVLNFIHMQKMSETISESKEEEYRCNLIGLTPSTLYNLQICSENQIGRVFAPLLVRTNGKPYPPENFECSRKGITETSITVQWTAGLDDGGYKQLFVLDILSGNKLVDSDKIDDDGRHESFHKTWDDLKESTRYLLTLYAKNEFGESEKLTLDKRTYGKPDPPTEFKVAENGVSENSIKVLWKPGFDGGYRQTFYVEINGEVNKVKRGVCEYNCSKLNERTTYDISLKAENKVGVVLGVQAPLSVETYGRPDTPTSLELVEKTEETITMKWKPGKNGGSPQHFILIDLSSRKPLAEDIPDAHESIQHTITNLTKGTKYKLQVISKNKYGTSLPSSDIDVKTKGSPFQGSADPKSN